MPLLRSAKMEMQIWRLRRNQKEQNWWIWNSSAKWGGDRKADSVEANKLLPNTGPIRIFTPPPYHSRRQVKALVCGTNESTLPTATIHSEDCRWLPHRRLVYKASWWQFDFPTRRKIYRPTHCRGISFSTGAGGGGRREVEVGLWQFCWESSARDHCTTVTGKLLEALTIEKKANKKTYWRNNNISLLLKYTNKTELTSRSYRLKWLWVKQ